MKIAMYDNDGKPRQVRCPFGIRDLSKYECYSGNSRNKCKFFKCYDHVLSGSNGGKSQSYIVCRGTVDLLQQEIPFDWKL